MKNVRICLADSLLPEEGDASATHSESIIALLEGGRRSLDLEAEAPPNAKICKLTVRGRIRLQTADDGADVASGETLSIESLRPELILIADSDNIESAAIVADFSDEQGSRLKSLKVHVDIYRIQLSAYPHEGANPGINFAQTDQPENEALYSDYLLVNNDRDTLASQSPDYEDAKIGGINDLKDMTCFQIDISPQPALDLKLKLSVSEEDSHRLRVFSYSLASSDGANDVKSKVLLCPRTSSVSVDLFSQSVAGSSAVDLAVEGLCFHALESDGNIKLTVELSQDKAIIAAGRVELRVAPWIMMSVADRPRKICTYARGEYGNGPVSGLQQVLDRHKGIRHELLERPIGGNEYWIQDHIEFGFTATPRQKHDVVLHDKHARQTVDRYFSGPNMGTERRRAYLDGSHSIRAFGNIMASPPINVNGIEYPFGRIVIGGSIAPKAPGGRVSSRLKDFLRAQKVQAPFEMETAWLATGHLDEILAFVMVKGEDRKFKALLASPRAFYEICVDLNRKKQGAQRLFQNKTLAHEVDIHSNFPSDPFTSRESNRLAECSIHELLTNNVLYSRNMIYQRYLDINEHELQKNLNLHADDIIHIPALFASNKYQKAVAYFPNMVNCAVWNDLLFIPKPGVTSDGEPCILEHYVGDKLKKLDYTPKFIDVWDEYHHKGGNIHCATKILREARRENWWDLAKHLM